MKKMPHDLLKAIEKIDIHDHICLIYENQKDQFKTAIPYIRIGLERHERCLYITDDNSKNRVIKEMQKDGIDVDRSLKEGSLVFSTKNDSYLKGGKFDPDALINKILLKGVTEAKKDGYKALRITGEMTWALGDEPGNDRLVEYEAKLNYFFPKHDASAICQYNKNRFPAALIKNIVYMHPIVAYDGWVLKNTLYIPPSDFLYHNTDEEKLKSLLANIRLTDEVQEEKFRALRQFETILMQLPAAVIVAEAPSGKLVIANKQVDEIWRHPFIKAARIGTYKAYKGFHKSGREYRPEEWPLARSLTLGEVVTNEEIRILQGDGTYGYINNSSSPIRDSEGRIVAAVVTFHDITGKIEQEKQKDEFMGIVSHELKTPVTSLKAFGQVLQSRFSKAGDLESAKHLKKMDAQINRLTVLIGDLLDVTKIEAGKLQFHNTSFNFDELISGIVEEVQLTTNKHRILIKGKTDRTVFADKERLGQVLTNLLTNAIKYSPLADKVIVKLDKSEQQVICSVKDFGVGIAKSEQQKLFNRFYRITGSEELTYPGLGLGLYISKEIINRQDGRIWLESKRGHGSTFSFSLPTNPDRHIKQQINPDVEREIMHE